MDDILDMVLAGKRTFHTTKHYLRFDYMSGLMESDGTEGPWTPCASEPFEEL